MEVIMENKYVIFLVLNSAVDIIARSYMLENKAYISMDEVFPTIRHLITLIKSYLLIAIKIKIMSMHK